MKMFMDGENVSQMQLPVDYEAYIGFLLILVVQDPFTFSLALVKFKYSAGSLINWL